MTTAVQLKLHTLQGHAIVDARPDLERSDSDAAKCSADELKILQIARLEVGRVVACQLAYPG